MNTGHVFHRMPRQTLPRAVGGEGIWVIDQAGKRYLDASGGAAVSCLGHSERRVSDAVAAQLGQLPFIHSGFFTTEAAEQLADMLVERAPGELDAVYFVSGGSEATEAALKLCHQYHQENGDSERVRIIARRQSYHGNTLGALGIGGNLARRQGFAPLLASNMSHIGPCYAYRGQAADETPEDYGQRCADELEAEIQRLGPHTVAAFVAETVVGATAGALVAVPGYFRRVREICDRYGVLLILDEVMCGSGRTGTLFACEQEGVVPDLLTMAKGLGAGYQPLGALLVSRQIYRTVVDGSGFFQHGHTYMCHAAACACGVAVLRVLDQDNLLDNVRRQGENLRARLGERFGDHPHVGDIRGRGLFQAIELVADRADKTPFDPRLRLHARIKAAAMARGLMCYPMGGTVDGERGDHVLLAPPYIITEAEVTELVTRLGDAVEAVLAEVLP